VSLRVFLVSLILAKLTLCSVTYLVLDEADRMLDKGFENDIRTIIGYTASEGRQTLMCTRKALHTRPHTQQLTKFSSQCNMARFRA